MSLIFNDTLQVTNGTGIYSLKALINGVWTHVYTISGPQNGSIAIDSAINTIDVDTSLLPVGQTFDFMWVDSSGNQSNVVTALVPFTILGSFSAQENITWTNNGGDSWTFNMPYTPPYNDPSDELLNSITFYNSSGSTSLVNLVFSTTAQSYSYSGLGAGTYVVETFYANSALQHVVISQAWLMVDGAGNVLRSLTISGFSDISFSGMNISCTPNYQATNATIENALYISYDANFENQLNFLTTTAPLVGQQLPPQDTAEMQLAFDLILDASEWTPGVVSLDNINGCVMSLMTNIS